MATYGPGNRFVALPDSENNSYTGFAFGFALVDYGDQSGPITVTFNDGLGEGAGTVTRQGGHTDALSFIYAIAGSKLGGTTVISADNQYRGIQFLPQGGDNTLVANGVAGTQDIFDYELSPTGVYADMAGSFVLNGWGGKDTIVGSIAGFEGASHFNDVIFGDNSDNNQFRPLEGSNFIDARGGNDLLLYDDFSSIRGISADIGKGVVANSYGGHDKILNFNALVGTPFSDVIFGAAKGNSYLEGGAGNNIIIGRGSHNSIGFNSAQANAQRGVFIDLGTGIDYNSGLTGGFGNFGTKGGFDTLINIQSAGAPRFGSILIGSKGDNDLFLNGGSGAAKSYVFGSDGNDSINGTDHDYIVIYPGKHTAYHWSFDSGHNINIQKPKGSDFIAATVHALQFSDGTYNVDTHTFSHAIPDHSTGTDNNDALIGTKGDDTFHSGNGQDLIYGYGGTDTAVFAGSSSDFDIVVRGQFTSISSADVDTILIGVAKLQFDDGIFFTKAGGAGNDSVQLGSGLIAADGGLGVNTVVASGVRAEYIISGGGSSATLTDTVGSRDGTVSLRNFQLAAFTDQTVDIHNPLNQLINGVSSKSETVTGSSLGDSIYVGVAAKQVLADDGDDTIYLFGGSKANVSVDGGDGSNVAVFTGIAAQYTFTGTATGLTVSGPDGSVRLSHIDILQFSDSVVGIYSVDEALAAFVPGNPSPYSWGVLNDTASNVTAHLDELEDLVENLAVPNFNAAPFISAVCLTTTSSETLSITALQSMNDQRIINLIQGQFRLVITGTTGDDTLIGQTGPFQLAGNTLNADAGNDRLMGGFGNDTLDGGAGTDLLTGGLGKDHLTGGLDDDTFKFNAIGEISKGANRDVITDFASGIDHIDLSGIDANSKKAGDQDFGFVSSQIFHHKAGELHVLTNSGIFLVEGDVNGDGKADFQIEVHSLSKPLSSDFVL